MIIFFMHDLLSGLLNADTVAIGKADESLYKRDRFPRFSLKFRLNDGHLARASRIHRSCGTGLHRMRPWVACRPFHPVPPYFSGEPIGVRERANLPAVRCANVKEGLLPFRPDAGDACGAVKTEPSAGIAIAGRSKLIPNERTPVRTVASSMVRTGRGGRTGKGRRWRRWRRPGAVLFRGFG
jgi:hypothetical protein